MTTLKALPNIRDLIEKLEQRSTTIDRNEDGYLVPPSIKEQFGKAWGKPFTVKTDLIKLYTGSDTTNNKSVYLVDPLLIKCAFAVELYDAYADYMRELTRVRDELGLSKAEWKQLGEDSPLAEPLRRRIIDKIDSLSDLDVDAKQRLKGFATLEKAKREEEFGGFKGLSRAEPFQPVVSTALGQRIDYSGYIHDVIKTLQSNRSLVTQLKELSPIDTQEDTKEGEAWTDGEWALAMLIYNRHVIPAGLTRAKAEFSRRLVNATTRSAGSWDRRIANIRFALTGNGLSGGGDTPERAKTWQAEYEKDPRKLESIANNIIALNPDGTYIRAELKLEKRPEGFDAQLFEAKLMAAGFVCDAVLPSSFVAAIATKPFTILTGNSGTGKTKLAELFSSWLCANNSQQFAVVPVGADWTDNRNVLGFVNHVRHETVTIDGKQSLLPIYQSTPVLDLLLAAAAEQTKPFFIILDEMNLSHVERYFADFLSAMESIDGELLLHREGPNVKLPRQPGGPCDVPETLPLPRNVFVVGTVNVDETTYMFSPKVLDRANVIEFPVRREDVAGFISIGGGVLGDIESAPAGYAEGFLELSRRARTAPRPNLDLLRNATLTNDVKEKLHRIHSVLEHLFEIMQRSHWEFAYRTISEILRYAAVDYELTKQKKDWNWQSCMDAQIMQKILPKVHGSRRQIESLLIRLARYCEKGEVPKDDNTPPHLQPDRFKPIGDALFKRSYQKLCDMIEAVRRDQFVSFIQ